MKIKLREDLAYHLLGLAFAASLLFAVGIACGDGDGADDSGTASPSISDGAVSPSPVPGTPAPPDPGSATDRFLEFVDYVQAEDAESAWNLYIASVPGDLTQHNAALGCEYSIFAGESSAMKHMFDRISPFTVEETFGAAQGSFQIEIKLIGSDENEYLATLNREPADAPYRLRFFNNGRPAGEPGVPDPFPSPEDPRGFCGIWTGPR